MHERMSITTLVIHQLEHLSFNCYSLEIDCLSLIREEDFGFYEVSAKTNCQISVICSYISVTSRSIGRGSRVALSESAL